MSRLMADLCQLLRVKHLRTTVYHPQTDGLVERFQPDPQTNAAEGGSRRPAGLGPDAPLCPFWYTGGSAGINGLYTVELLFGRQPRDCSTLPKKLGNNNNLPTPVPRRACLRDEAADRSHHAISPGTPGTTPSRPNNATITVQLSLGSSRRATKSWFWSHLRLQVSGHLAGAVHGGGKSGDR